MNCANLILAFLMVGSLPSGEQIIHRIILQLCSGTYESRRSSCKLRNTLSITAFSAYFKASYEINEYVWKFQYNQGQFLFFYSFFSNFYINKRRFSYEKQVKKQRGQERTTFRLCLGHLDSFSASILNLKMASRWHRNVVLFISCPR